MSDENELAVAPSEQKEEIPLIAYLRNLAARQDRSALAHLRRGLNSKPGESMEMFPYVGRFVSEKMNVAHDRAVFLTSALFADYADAAPNIGDLGRSVKQIVEKSASIERRFVALLDAEPDDLHYYLRQMIGLLKANGIAVNWTELFKDIRAWGSEKRSVQKKWARSFWGGAETIRQHNLEEKGEENQ